MNTFWLSFCDPKLPKGSQFKGVTIVQAVSFQHAITRAWNCEANPGGEVQGTMLETADAKIIPESYLNRLLTRAECDVLGAMFREGGAA